jgi:hypothetical protein
MSFDFEKFANTIENGLKQTHEMSHNKIFIFNPSVNEYFSSANNMRKNSKTKNTLMKQFILLLLAFISCHLLQAQNVGIGTGTPTSKLHLVGNFLQESGTMTLNNPSATIQLQNAGADKATMFLSGENLRIGTNLGNTLGSVYIQSNGSPRLTALPNGNVGIGTLSPTEKLHVSGNILSTNRIDANGVIEGAGISSTGTLYVNSTSLLQGAVTGNASATFNSTITSNTSMIINDPTAILQLQSAGVGKGFMQLSGDNMRLGTNSGNTTGNVVVRMNGNDRITINPAGDMSTEGKINRAGLGTADFLPICYGRVGGNGSVLSGGSGNFFVTRNGPGDYSIFVTNENTNKIVMVTPIIGCFCIVGTTTIGPNSTIIVEIKDYGSGAPLDYAFNFLVFRN